MTSIKRTSAEIASQIATMGRNTVKERILGFHGRFKLDFTEDYLDTLPLERLRHILLAAMLQQNNSN